MKIIRKIDALGRIVVPKDVRISLNLNVNDDVEIEVEDDKVVIKKSNEQHKSVISSVMN